MLDIVKGVLYIGVISIVPYLIYCGLPIWKGLIMDPWGSALGHSILENIGFATSMFLVFLLLLCMIALIMCLIDRSAEIQIRTCKRK